MAADVPVRKAAAKKAAVKKAAVKKAAVKKAAVKKVSPATTAFASVEPPAAEQPPAPDVIATERPAAPSAGTFVETLLALDWRLTARIAGPSFLVLFAAASVIASSLLLAPATGQSLGGFAGVGGYFHAVALLAAMAFGSSATAGVTASGEESSFTPTGGITCIPMTVTLVVLVIFGGLFRRYLTVEGTVQRLGAVVRTGLVFALLVMGLSFFARTTVGSSEDSAHIGASPAAVFGWAVVLTFIVGAAVALVPGWLARLRKDERRAPQLVAWRLPLEGGLAALVCSVLLGGVVFLAAIFLDHTSGHPPASSVARALPIIAGYFLNIGLAVTGFAMGAKVGVTGAGVDGQASIGYTNLHELSPAYFLLLLLPIISIALGVLWMLHRRRDEDGQTLGRACYRMAASYAVGWVILATISRASLGAGVFGGVHAGPQLLVGFGLAIGWAGVVGFVIGRLLLPRSISSVRLPTPRLSAPSWRTVSVLSAIVIAVMVVIDAASGGAAATARSSSPRSGSLRVATPAPRPPTVAPVVPAPTFAADARTQGALVAAAAGERIYKAQHGRFSANEEALGVLLVPDVDLQIVTATRDHFCMRARVVPDGAPFSYSDTTASPVRGDVC